MDILSHCPRCGGPIYGRRSLADEHTPQFYTKFSCDCRKEKSESGLGSAIVFLTMVLAVFGVVVLSKVWHSLG